MARSSEIDDIFAKPGSASAIASASASRSASTGGAKAQAQGASGKPKAQAVQTDISGAANAPRQASGSSGGVGGDGVSVSKNARRKLAKRAKAASASTENDSAPGAAVEGGTSAVRRKERVEEDGIEIVTAPADVVDMPPAVSASSLSGGRGGQVSGKKGKNSGGGVEDDADAAYTDFRGSKSKRRRTEEGYLIYRADELQLDNRSDAGSGSDAEGEDGGERHGGRSAEGRKKASRIDYDQAGTTPECPFDCRCCF